MTDNSEEKPPRGILFVLEDDTEWAFMLPREEMTPRGVLGLEDDSEEENLSPGFAAHFFPGNDRLH